MKEKDNNEKSEKRAAHSIGGGKKSLFIKIGIIAGAAVLVLIIVSYVSTARASVLISRSFPPRATPLSSAAW
ncbi:MAG: hypothetical protein ACLTTQ_03485 [Christensenellales bacterium]